jgi:Kdo2-lipid IVA lauroyltransferase/acyltransferase
MHGAVLLLGLDVPAPSAADVPASPLARAGVRLLLGAIRRLPGSARDWLAAAVGGIAFAMGVRRRVVLEGLAWAFPFWTAHEIRSVARRTYQHLGRTALDAALSQRLSPEALEATVSMEDAAVFDRELAKGKGLLVATAHLGNWEVLGEAMTGRGLRLNAVVRPLRGAFNAEVVAGRVRSGMRLIAQRGALRGTLAALRRNEAVTVLLDQAIGGKHALHVPFFGRPAATTPLLSAAALHSGAPVLVGLAPYVDGRLRLHVQGPFPVPSTGDRARDLWTHAAAVTAAIERAIRAHPEQWLWLHRRWKLPAPPGDALRLELLALVADEDRVLAFHGEGREVQAIRRRNVEWLLGLPQIELGSGLSLAGREGAEAAWRIVEHAGSDPELLQLLRPLAETVASVGKVPEAEFQAWERRVVWRM